MTEDRKRRDILPYTITESPEPQRSLLKSLWARPRRKNNTFCTVTGSTGSGKSYGNIFFGYMLDVDSLGNHEFCEDDIIFDPIDFVDKVPRPKRIGHFFMKDEIQLDAHARTSMSTINKILGDVMSTIRFKREILFFNLPSETQLDPQIRLLRYGNFEFKGVDDSMEYSTFNFDMLNYPKKADTKNVKEKKISRDPLVLWNNTENDYLTLDYYDDLKLYLPFHRKDFAHLLKRYDEKKDDYLMGQFDKYKKKLKEYINSKSDENNSLEKQLNYIDKNREEFGEGKKLSLVAIQKKFSVPISMAKMIRSEYHNTHSIDKKEAKSERSKYIELLTKKRNELKNL